MDKKDLEELKKRFENTEFNNLEEDLRVSKEGEIRSNKEKKDDISYYEEKDKKKNLTIIILSVCLIVLFAILIIFLLSNKSDDNNSTNNTSNTNSSNNQTNNEEHNEEKDVKINDEDYNYSYGTVYYNKYIYVPAKEGTKKAIADLEENIIYEADTSWKIYQTANNSLYIVDLKYLEDGNMDIKKIKDNSISSVFNDKASGLLLNKDDSLLGVYKKDDGYDTLYIFNDSGYNTIKLNTYGTYASSASKGNKYLYNNRYLITFKDNGNDNEKYGLYDVVDNRQFINEIYDRIEYLNDDRFVAVKNDKSGVINRENKVLLEFNYDLITYSNGLYFVGNNGKLNILDSNFKELNKEIEIPNLNKFDYSICCGSINPFELIAYKNYVIVKIGYLPNSIADYVIVDKQGNITPLGKGNIGFVGDYFVKSNEDDNFIIMYDGSMNVAHKIDVGEKAIKLDNIYLFLNKTLVINKKRTFNLENDTSKGTTNWYRRISQEFEVKLDIKGDTGTITISSNEQVLKTIENVSVNDFLAADNNGITITNTYFIYNADGIAVIKRTPQAN